MAIKSFKIASSSITNREDTLKLYLKEVSKIPLLSQEEECEMARLAKQGDRKAFERLIGSNLRFVISVAKQYQNKGLTLIDLINEGNIGLIRAAEKFDETRGFKFISYAIWWIRQAIFQALGDQSRTIRLPINQVNNITKVAKAVNRFEQENQRQPSFEELEEILQIPEDKIIEICSTTQHCTSIDVPFKDTEESTLEDILPNPNSPDSDQVLLDESKNTSIMQVLEYLPDREHDIILMFFGIGMKEMVLDEISRYFGVSTERVRQMKEKALQILRQHKSELIDI